MALEPLSPRTLAETPTVFASFMGHVDRRQRPKTVGQLLAIYRERRGAPEAAIEHAENLRVDRFMADMAANRWTTNVVMRLGIFDGRTLVIDGIHRGIAYLACVEQGISPELLPPLCVEC